MGVTNLCPSGINCNSFPDSSGFQTLLKEKEQSEFSKVQKSDRLGARENAGFLPAAFSQKCENQNSSVAVDLKLV